MFVTAAECDIRMRRLSKRKQGEKNIKTQARGGGSRDLGHMYCSNTNIVQIHSSYEMKDLVDTDLRNIACVILRSRVLIIYVGACYTRGAGSRRSCRVWGRRGR